jgi:DNA primase
VGAIEEAVVDIDLVKEKNPVEDVIGETYPLRGRGRWLRAEQHSSLIVDTHNQSYFWNKHDERGDVIAWIQKRKKQDFKGAVEYLCERARMPRPTWGESSKAAIARRDHYDGLTVAARHFVRRLRDETVGGDARDYCQARGWTEDTIQAAGLGFADGDQQMLRGEFSMHGIEPSLPAAAAGLRISAGMLIYPHVERGRVVYVSARSLEGKRHYNPPEDLVGKRRVYLNWRYAPLEEQIVVVEGQADAVTLGQWGLAAVGLCGVSIDEDLLKMLGRHKEVYVALDQDEAGIAGARKIADALGPLTRIVTWPEGAKDANDYLQKGGTTETCEGLLAAAPTWVAVLAAEVAEVDPSDRSVALQRAFGAIGKLNEFDVQLMREELATTMDVRLSGFDQLLRQAKKEIEENRQKGDPVIDFSAVGGVLDGHFLETLYIPPDGERQNTLMALNTGQTLFAIRYPDGTIDTKPFFDHDGIRYRPIEPSLPVLQEGAVVFAPAVGPAMRPRELWDEIRRVIHKYVDVDEFYEALAAYYVLCSWFYDVFDTLAYLRVIGDAGTGKSRFLQVVGNLCFRPVNMNAGASISSMFRLLHLIRGTLILDEGDFAGSDETTDIAKLLNVGYQRRQGYIYRSGSRDRDFATELYVVFGPKVIATRKDFEDNAIRSRCLTKEMGAPTTRKDIPDNLPDSFWFEEVPRMQSLLLRFRLDTWDLAINDRPVERDESVEPRLRQVTSALMKIIADDPEMKGELKAFIRQYTREMIIERGLQTEAKILEAMYIQHTLEKKKPETERNYSVGTLATIANDLIDYENELPIAQWSRHQVKDRNRGISARGAGRCIDNLQLRKERRGERRRYHVVWDPERIDALWKRYGLGDDDARVALLRVHHEIQALVEDHERAMPTQPDLM